PVRGRRRRRATRGRGVGSWRGRAGAAGYSQCTPRTLARAGEPPDPTGPAPRITYVGLSTSSSAPVLRRRGLPLMMASHRPAEPTTPPPPDPAAPEPPPAAPAVTPGGRTTLPPSNFLVGFDWVLAFGVLALGFLIA